MKIKTSPKWKLCNKVPDRWVFSVFISEIPHFKEVVIMATLCDSCGHKTNEVKSGGGIEPTGKKMTLKVETEEDLSRDLLKVRKVMHLQEMIKFK